jgi:penicillin amidase
MTLRDAFGEAGLAFFAPLLTPADAALDGSSAPLPPLPGPKVIDLRASPTASAAAPRFVVPPSGGRIDSEFRLKAELPTTLSFDRLVPGSNAFALSGAHTATGAGLLASDMHLNLRVPNVWYRAALRYPGHAVTGLTLPGVPVVIAGSNGHVAWSFTNAYVDTGDIVTVDMNPVANDLYRAPGHDDLLSVDHRQETIEVHGRKPEQVAYDWTIWGPIVGHDEDHRALVYMWTGHDSHATNLALLHMEDAADAAAAVEVAHDAGMPAQNIVIADSHGTVAWTIAGKIPRRVGYSGRLPVTFQFGDRSWNGFVPSAEIPVVTSSARPDTHSLLATDGRIWSANQRMVGGEMLKVLGDGGYGRPNRAAQLRDDLKPLEHAVPRDFLAVQLDDRALFLEPWHRLLLDTLSPQVTAENEVRARLRGFVEKWEGRASIDAVSYPVVRRFRIAVYTRVFQPIFARCTEIDPKFNWTQLQLEQPIWALLQAKPKNLLAPQYPSWDALLVAAVDDVIADLDHDGIRLPYATWGQRNRADIRHPFSYSLPWFFRPTLDMPADPLPGDNDMPRVQGPSFGASERFVVSPGHEEDGICHLPCGQSGHPLSPYYRAGHEAWVKGEPTPFLPGQTEHTLTLEPKG